MSFVAWETPQRGSTCLATERPNTAPSGTAFDRFAPLIDLKVADVWEPKTPGLQRFALALGILGFVLLPLAFASISGMFQ